MATRTSLLAGKTAGFRGCAAATGILGLILLLRRP
jgi:hypothetical protein